MQTMEKKTLLVKPWCAIACKMHPDFRDIKMGEMCILEGKKQNGNKVVIVIATSNCLPQIFTNIILLVHLSTDL